MEKQRKKNIQDFSKKHRKESDMARVMSMMVVFLLALVLRTTPVKAVDCVSVISSIFPCTNFLGNPNPILPGTQCCDAATNVVSNGDDVDTLCRCLRQNPLSSGFLPSKAQQLPNVCNLSSFLPLVNCL